MKKTLIAGLLSVFLLLSVPACSFFQPLFEDKVATTQDNVQPGVTAIPAPLPGVSEEDKKKLADAGKTPVLVDKDGVIDPSKAVDVTDPGQDGVYAGAEVLISIAKTLFPGIAALEALGLIFSQRKRKHYGTALAALIPYEGTVDVSEATKAILAGLGYAHSSPETKKVFETSTTKTE